MTAARTYQALCAVGSWVSATDLQRIGLHHSSASWLAREGVVEKKAAVDRWAPPLGPLEQIHLRIMSRTFYRAIAPTATIPSAQEQALIEHIATEGYEMTPKRQTQLVRGLTTICAKVYEATPISEPWPAARVLTELNRTGCGIPLDSVRGCLSSLVGSGLVAEPQRGSFQRVAVRDHAPEADEDYARRIVAAPPPAPPPPPSTPLLPATLPALPVAGASPKLAQLDRLASIGASMRAMAELAGQIASEVDAAALAAQEEMDSMQAGTEKLRQLQALLKSLA